MSAQICFEPRPIANVVVSIDRLGYARCAACHAGNPIGERVVLLDIDKDCDRCDVCGCDMRQSVEVAVQSVEIEYTTCKIF